jgi:hypothetical protein
MSFAFFIHDISCSMKQRQVHICSQLLSKPFLGLINYTPGSKTCCGVISELRRAPMQDHDGYVALVWERWCINTPIEDWLVFCCIKSN